MEAQLPVTAVMLPCSAAGRPRQRSEGHLLPVQQLAVWAGGWACLVKERTAVRKRCCTRALWPGFGKKLAGHMVGDGVQKREQQPAAAAAPPAAATAQRQPCTVNSYAVTHPTSLQVHLLGEYQLSERCRQADAQPAEGTRFKLGRCHPLRGGSAVCPLASLLTAQIRPLPASGRPAAEG